MYEEAFSSFPALQELEMPVNALRGVSVDDRHFLQLQVIVDHRLRLLLMY